MRELLTMAGLAAAAYAVVCLVAARVRYRRHRRGYLHFLSHSDIPLAHLSAKTVERMKMEGLVEIDGETVRLSGYARLLAAEDHSAASQ